MTVYTYKIAGKVAKERHNNSLLLWLTEPPWDNGVGTQCTKARATGTSGESQHEQQERRRLLQ